MLIRNTNNNNNFLIITIKILLLSLIYLFITKQHYSLEFMNFTNRSSDELATRKQRKFGNYWGSLYESYFFTKCLCEAFKTTYELFQRFLQFESKYQPIVDARGSSIAYTPKFDEMEIILPFTIRFKVGTASISNRNSTRSTFFCFFAVKM